MISFNQVSKSFAKQDILLDCSFQVNAGERVGIIGANGSGKSTVFKLLLDLEHPDQGQISRPKNLRLGYLPQDVLHFHGKTVLNQVMEVAKEVQTIEAELSLLTDRSRWLELISLRYLERVSIEPLKDRPEQSQAA